MSDQTTPADVSRGTFNTVARATVSGNLRRIQGICFSIQKQLDAFTLNRTNNPIDDDHSIFIITTDPKYKKDRRLVRDFCIWSGAKVNGHLALNPEKQWMELCFDIKDFFETETKWPAYKNHTSVPDNNFDKWMILACRFSIAPARVNAPPCTPIPTSRTELIEILGEISSWGIE